MTSGLHALHTGHPSTAMSLYPERVEFQAEPVEFSKYAEAFRIVIDNARAGKTYLTNLTFPIQTNNKPWFAPNISSQPCPV